MNAERFVIDTNIFILRINDRLAELLPRGEIICSVITEIELLSFPELTSSEETLIRAALVKVVIYGIDQDIKEEANSPATKIKTQVAGRNYCRHCDLSRRCFGDKRR